MGGPGGSTSRARVVVLLSGTAACGVSSVAPGVELRSALSAFAEAGTASFTVSLPSSQEDVDAFLTAAGEDAVDPRRRVLYGERMYDTPGCPYVRFNRDLPVRYLDTTMVGVPFASSLPAVASMSWSTSRNGTRRWSASAGGRCGTSGCAAAGGWRTSRPSSACIRARAWPTRRGGGATSCSAAAPRQLHRRRRNPRSHHLRAP